MVLLQINDTRVSSPYTVRNATMDKCNDVMYPYIHNNFLNNLLLNYLISDETKETIVSYYENLTVYSAP